MQSELCSVHLFLLKWFLFEGHVSSFNSLSLIRVVYRSLLLEHNGGKIDTHLPATREIQGSALPPMDFGFLLFKSCEGGSCASQLLYYNRLLSSRYFAGSEKSYQCPDISMDDDVKKIYPRQYGLHQGGMILFVGELSDLSSQNVLEFDHEWWCQKDKTGSV